MYVCRYVGIYIMNLHFCSQFVLCSFFLTLTLFFNVSGRRCLRAPVWRIRRGQDTLAGGAHQERQAPTGSAWRHLARRGRIIWCVIKKKNQVDDTCRAVATCEVYNCSMIISVMCLFTFVMTYRPRQTIKPNGTSAHSASRACRRHRH